MDNNFYDNECIGHVIRIIDNQTVIIDTGKDILKKGDVIDIFEYGEELYDLNGNVLCRYMHIKDTLTVLDTENKYSVCKKEKTIVRKINYSLSPLLESFSEITEKVPLNVDKNSITPIQKIDLTIKLGDLVKMH